MGLCRAGDHFRMTPRSQSFKFTLISYFIPQIYIHKYLSKMRIAPQDVRAKPHWSGALSGATKPNKIDRAKRMGHTERWEE